MKKNLTICISLILLLAGAKTSQGNSQNSLATDTFNGFFRQETYGNGKPNAKSPISASFVFQESGNGSRYAIYISPFAFFYPKPQREYEVQGILVQKFLPEKAKDDDYRRIIQFVYPYFTSDDTKQAAKAVKDWMKKHNDTPLLLINSVWRAEWRAKPPVDLTKQPPSLARFANPVFPEEARVQRIEGEVELNVVIDEDGIVELVIAIQGNPILRAAAIDAVREWKFIPAIIDEKAVASTAVMRISFSGGFSSNTMNVP